MNTVPLSDGGYLNVRVDGPQDAPWLVLSNSVLTDVHIWDGQLAALSQSWRVLRYDQRGHGGSSLPVGPMSFAQYGSDLLAVLDAYAVDHCVFMGLSMGVPTGLAALSQAPERFSGFIAVDGVARSAAGREAFWTERRETARMQGMGEIARGTAARWLPGEEADSPVGSRLQTMIEATPVAGFASATSALQSYDYTHSLAKLRCPFLSIAGALDGAMPQTMAAQFADLPNATHVQIPDAGHIPNFQNPIGFNAALTPFLNALVRLPLKETL